ncbi:hypothetical protein [Butyrivibrio sp. INlla16]|uniref:hypothetical protein n=1 Tax=Butyrivibrio sp. INlla16 TaxID=1520807 RepID=UPI0008824705|nr:hypothetical protein [Butyrivibrio sp. INlla16]SDB62042.1 hypothetical protein SAMN02910263_03337 [Butyrivibrio sp. INlla16]
MALFLYYACAKEVVRQYRKPLEKLGLTYTQYIVMMVLWKHGDMTEEGKALKDKALKVPSEMERFLKLPNEDITHLKRILDRAVGLMWPDKT